MGLEITVTTPPGAAPALAALTHDLAAAGVTAMIVMVDNVLQTPGAALPTTWRDVRLRTPAGTLTVLRRDPTTLAVVVFGNADAPLQAAQQQVAAALRAMVGA